ncbi:MAG: 30S ribosomal protein S2 [Caldilineaceae bacterium]
MSVISMKELLEAGVHFGHRTRRWNPKMRPYIFTERSGIHIIDLQQTMVRINSYAEMIRDIVAKGGTILFVGTKRQAQATVQQEADRCRMPYINQRWLGGTLTNWVTIKQRIDYLLQQERRVDAGEYRTLSKKEQLGIQREIDKLNHRIGGLKTMRRLPDMLFIVDTNTEDLAVLEANKLKIPILAMVDTNSNPDLINYVIPSNDDAIRAVKLIVSVIADAVEEGLRIREVDMVDTGQVSQEDLESMEQYLGPSTLAKLKAPVKDFEAFEEEDLDGYASDEEDEMEELDDDYEDLEDNNEVEFVKRGYADEDE